MKTLLDKQTTSQLLKQFVMAVLMSVAASLSAAAMKDTLEVKSAYFNLPIPGRDMTAAYLQLSNTSEQSALSLVGYRSEQVKTVELHQSVMQNEMMRMRRVETLVIAPKDNVVLQPGDYHLMLFGLQSGLKESDTLVIELCFADSSSINVTFEARALR